MSSDTSYLAVKRNTVTFLKSLIEKIDSGEVKVKAVSVDRYMNPIFRWLARPLLGFEIYGYTVTIDIHSPETIIFDTSPHNSDRNGKMNRKKGDMK